MQAAGAPAVHQAQRRHLRSRPPPPAPGARRSPSRRRAADGGSRAPVAACPAAGHPHLRCGPRSPSGPPARGPGRRTISRAMATACSGVRMEERLGPDLHPAAREVEAQVELDADPHRIRVARAPAPAISSRWSIESTITIGRPSSSSRASSRQRRAIGGRVRQQQVAEAVVVQPQRLVQRVRHQPAKALVPGQDPLQDGRERTDLLATRIGFPAARRVMSRCVEPHRVEVHEGEGRVQPAKSRSRAAWSSGYAAGVGSPRAGGVGGGHAPMIARG